MREFDCLHHAGFEPLRPHTVKDLTGTVGGLDCVYAHEKVDGHRLILGVRPKGLDGKSVALTTTGHDILDRIREVGYRWPLNVLKMPDDTWLDCELCVAGRPASYVKTALANGDPALAITCHAIPVFAGDLIDCYPLEDVEDMCIRHGVPFTEWEHCWPKQLLSEWETKARARKLEGWVFKRANYSGWYKLKVENTVDLVVTGFVDGNGKHIGLVGSLRGSTYHNTALVEVACVGGMDDETRLAIDEKRDLGRVMEVRYQQLGSGGRLRHPRFIRWRDDKLPTACSSSEDPDVWRALNLLLG